MTGDSEVDVVDYENIGLRCGLEVHQQLDTCKLFCRCPSEIRDESSDVVIRRRLRAVAGEVGGVDPAALHEFLRGRVYVYEAYEGCNCLVELDEEPPHPINREALSVAVEVALLLNAKLVDEVQVMRKTVIDGSNTSGFQRTALIALDGFLETSAGIVRIPTVCLEEDAARKIGEEENKVVYRLDRLGVPLIEISTAPDIKSPEQAREVAEKLGMILRSTGKVKRGIGTIRQDLNISISGGERVEVKGVQDLRLVSKIVAGEVRRQLMLLNVRDELKRRGFNSSSVVEGFTDVSSLFVNTKSKKLKGFLDKGGVVYAVVLSGFRGLLKNKLGPELAQYARAVSGVGGIFHSDELPGYGITSEEVEAVRSLLCLDGLDAFVLVAERREVACKAVEVVLERARHAFSGVLNETRRVTSEGSSEYMRPLPGSARMYPETDEVLILLEDAYISEIKANLPALPEQQMKKFMDAGLSKELAGQLVRSKWASCFDDYVEKFPRVKPSVIATILLSMSKEVYKRFGVEIDSLGKEVYDEVLCLLNCKEISREVVPEVMAELAKSPGCCVRDVVEMKRLYMLSEDELKKAVDDVVSSNPRASEGVLLGKVMAEVRGRADIDDVKKVLMDRLKSG